MRNQHDCSFIGLIFLPPRCWWANYVVDYEAETDHFLLRVKGQDEGSWIPRKQLESALLQGEIRFACFGWAPKDGLWGKGFGGLIVPAEDPSWPISC